MARPLTAHLDDVLAKIGLDRSNAVQRKVFVDGDLLADHRLALRHRPRTRLSAYVEHDRTCCLGIGRPVHEAAGSGDPLLKAGQIEIEIGENMVLDGTALIAQRLEFWQPRDRARAPHHGAVAHLRHRRLKIGVPQRAMRILLEGVGGGLHLQVSPVLRRWRAYPKPRSGLPRYAAL